MEEKARFELPLLLPDVSDEGDACVERLQVLIANRPGVSRVHVSAGDGPRSTAVL